MNARERRKALLKILDVSEYDMIQVLEPMAAPMVAPYIKSEINSTVWLRVWRTVYPAAAAPRNRY